MSGKGNNDGKLFARGKVAELRVELNLSNRKDKNHAAKKIALKRVVANMTMSNNDMVALFPDVIRCMTIPSLEIKKMCFLYLVNYARLKPEVAVTALPVLLKDVEDSSPLVRALALRTMSYVDVKEFVAKLVNCVRNLIRDIDPYVRKTAAFAVAKAYEHDAGLVEDAKIIDSLNGMLRDENSTVVSSALAALMDIWERNESIKLTIDYSNASKIIHILPECSEWGQIYVLEALTCYTPQDSTEATILAERIAPRLSHSNSSVVLTSIRVMMYFMNYIADRSLVQSLCQKLWPPMVTLMSKGPEIQYLTLRNTLLILHRQPEVVCRDIKVFFCKYNDPIYVKVTKLELIYLLANEKNIKEVLAELREYASEIDVEFVRKSVRVIGKLAIKLDKAADKCIATLLELVETKVSYIVQEATVVIRNVFRRYPDQYESIISKLCENLDELDEPEAKAAMIWIIGQYADRIENSDELLEDFLFTFQDETVEVQLALLTATVKLFLKRPSKGQDMVPKVLRWATEETDNPDLRDRGYMYWRLLLRDIPAAKQVILGPKPAIAVESELVDPFILEELCLVIGSLATIYLKPIRSVFRYARVRKFGSSPALQKDLLPSTRTSRWDKSKPDRTVGSPAPASRSGLPTDGRTTAANGNPDGSGQLAVPQSLAPIFTGMDPNSPAGMVYPAVNNQLSPSVSTTSPVGDLSMANYFVPLSLDQGISSGQAPVLPASTGHQSQMEMLQRQFQAQSITRSPTVSPVLYSTTGPLFSAAQPVQFAAPAATLQSQQAGPPKNPSSDLDDLLM